MKRYPSSDKVHWFDVETGGLPEHRSFNFNLSEFQKWSALKGDAFYQHSYATFHANSPLLQLYATDLPHFDPAHESTQQHLISGTAPPSSLIRLPDKPWIAENGERVPLLISDWARENGLVTASQTATRTEEETLGLFFQDLEGKIAANKAINIGGWNVGYDLAAIERSTRRYDSLEKYHGWLGAKIASKEVNVVEGFDVFGESIIEYSAKHAEFAKTNLRMFPSGKIATSLEDLRRVPGWKLGNIIDAIGGSEAFNISAQAAKFHGAFFDTQITAAAYARLHEAQTSILEGTGVEEAFKQAGLHGPAISSEDWMSRIFQRSGWQKDFQRAAREGEREAGLAFEAVKSSRNVLIGAGVLGGLAIAGSLAFGKRRDRQTQIVGLSDLGLAADKRHELTDFGSGWRGLNDDPPSVNLSTLAMAGGTYGAFRYYTRNHPQSAVKVFSAIEKRFPRQTLNYFGFSQFASSFLPKKLDIGKDLLLNAGNLTQLGEHFQKLLGQDLNLAELAVNGLHFEQSGKSPYMRLAEKPEYSVRFLGYDPDVQKGGSRWAGASSRWKAPLDEPDKYLPKPGIGETAAQRWKSSWKQHVLSQTPINPKYGIEAEGLRFQPVFAEQEGHLFANLRQKAGISALELAEQPQKLFARIGLGLKSGSWNSAGGLVGNLLLKRALPIAAGLGALDYADYLTGHRLSTSILGLAPKANIARAELTDRLPGARKVTKWYEHHVPGAQWGPIALPLTGMVTGELIEMGYEALSGIKLAGKARKFGMKAGLLAMIPFIPGMLGSRKTASELRDIYSGDDPIPVRSGRWWWLNQTPWKGGRITGYRPHWYARMKSRPERVALYGSEEEYWRHHPILHPLKWLRNPYQLEEATSKSRPYPMSSPAFSNIPLIGPLLAATIGRLVKPPRRMHEAEWDGKDYTLFSPRVEPRGPNGLAPAAPKEEFGLADVFNRETEQAAEFTGLSGFLAKTFLNKARNNNGFGKTVYYEGSRQLTSWSRKYYDEQVGAGMGPDIGLDSTAEYSEPFRRFVQRDLKTLQANEIPNQMPHWLPGNDYMTDFRTGDPYTKVDSGASRLPGPGYEALHPELKDVPFEQYPDLERYKILSDVAPWSKEWFIYNTKLNEATLHDPERRIAYEQVRDHAQALKDSSEEFQHRRFSAPVERLTGVVKSATPAGIELEGGRRVQLSALGMKMSDLSAIALGEQNNLTRSQAATEAERRQQRLIERLAALNGKTIEMVVPQGTGEHSLHSRAVVFAGGQNLNRELIDAGLAREDPNLAGAEYQEMSGALGKAVGRLGEAASFMGDQAKLNPMRWTWGHEQNKFWGSRDPLEKYTYNELYGARMQHWETPLKSFAKPWLRSLSHKLTNKVVAPSQVQERRDFDMLTDVLEYLRSVNTYTNKKSRTAIGADVLADPAYLRSTLSGRDKYYFPEFLKENRDEERGKILEAVPEDFGRILQGQWIKQDIEVARASNKPVPEKVTEGGRLLTAEDLAKYNESRDRKETQLNYGDWQRSNEIANFFARKNICLPEDPDSPVYDPNIDYEDLKAKIIQEEGLDYHDFNIFDDRAATLWRKPYLDGASRELTAGNNKSVDDLRQSVEKMILAGGIKDPDVWITATSSRKQRQNLTINVEQQPDEEILRDVRRNPDAYREQAAA